MKRVLLVALGFAPVSLLPAGCNISTGAADGNASLNEEPEIRRVDDIQIEWVYACTVHAWDFEKNITNPRCVHDEPHWSPVFLVSNTSTTKTYEFPGWNFGKNVPKARDDLGNSYSAAYFMPGKRVFSGNGVAVAEIIEIRPRQYQYIAVPFELPHKSAKSMTVELPAKALGVQGVFRIKAPISPESRLERPLGWRASLPAGTGAWTPPVFTK